MMEVMDYFSCYSLPIIDCFSVHDLPPTESPPRVRRDPRHPQQDRVRGIVLLSRQTCPAAGRSALDQVPCRDVDQGQTHRAVPTGRHQHQGGQDYQAQWASRGDCSERGGQGGHRADSEGRGRGEERSSPPRGRGPGGQQPQALREVSARHLLHPLPDVRHSHLCHHPGWSQDQRGGGGHTTRGESLSPNITIDHWLRFLQKKSQISLPCPLLSRQYLIDRKLSAELLHLSISNKTDDLIKR